MRQVVPNSHTLPVAPTQQPKIHMDKHMDLTSLQEVPLLLTCAYKDTAGFSVSPSAFLPCCTLCSSSCIFFHYKGLPCRSISREGRNFSLASWQRRESGQNCFPKLDIKGGNSTEIFIMIKTRIPGLGVSLIPGDLCNCFFYRQPELHCLLPPQLQITTSYSHSPIF